MFRFMFTPTDFDEALRFFTDIMSLELVASWDDDGRGAILQAPAAQIELFGSTSGSLAADPDRPHRPMPADDALNVGLNWEVDRVDEFVAGATVRGATVLSDPADKPWGMRAATIQGPDGLLITVSELLDDT